MGLRLRDSAPDIERSSARGRSFAAQNQSTRRAAQHTIVTSAGTIVWLPELTAWARSIHDLLEPVECS